MGIKRPPGLICRGSVWHIDKMVKGHGRLCESTDMTSLQDAAEYMNIRVEQIRKQTLYGKRPDKTFADAADKYLTEATHKSLDRDENNLRAVLPFVGSLPINQVHEASLSAFITAMQTKGQKSGTTNRALGVVRRVLNLAARKWRHEGSHLSWLDTAPMITMLPGTDKRKPYPLSWAEQRRFFDLLPAYRQPMALFMVNTGTRDQEVCNLRWDWEQGILELGTSVFVVPGEVVKNKEDRVIVLNSIAKSVIDEQRGKHPEYVFTIWGHRFARMMTSGWKTARRKASLPQLRVHDLKHTFGRRLMAAGVPFEIRKDLLGHKHGDVTTHYSARAISDLIDAANKVCAGKDAGPTLTVIRESRYG